MDSNATEDVTQGPNGPVIDTIIALVVLGAAAALLLWMIPVHIKGPDSSRIFARLLAGGLVILGLMQLRTGLVRWRRAAGGPHRPPLFAGLVDRDTVKYLAVLALWGVEMMLMRDIGFYILAPAGIFVSMLLLDIRRPLVLAAWTLLPLPVIYAIFEIGLRLRLPRGLLGGLL